MIITVHLVHQYCIPFIYNVVTHCATPPVHCDLLTKHFWLQYLPYVQSIDQSYTYAYKTYSIYHPNPSVGLKVEPPFFNTKQQILYSQKNSIFRSLPSFNAYG